MVSGERLYEKVSTVWLGTGPFEKTHVTLCCILLEIFIMQTIISVTIIKFIKQ